MITPFLEKLILSGQARFKNWSYGAGALGCIPVTTGQTCIICDFTIEPFITPTVEKPGKHGPQADMQLIRLESGKTVNDYVIKWNDSGDWDGNRQAGYMAKKYDCFIIATDVIKIRIAAFPNWQDWAQVINAPMNDAQEGPAPLGYRGSNVLNWINFDTSGTYKPMTEMLNKLNSGPNSRDELNINFSPLTNPVLDVHDGPLINSIPVINFSVVYIDENLSKILMSSK